jgi:hypothetical protein
MTGTSSSASPNSRASGSGSNAIIGVEPRPNALAAYIIAVAAMAPLRIASSRWHGGFSKYNRRAALS